jgi:hypothetical protein
MHYQRQRKLGTLDDDARLRAVKRPVETCTVEGCDAPYKSRGYCATHYWRLWRHGDPLREPPESTGRWIDEKSGYVRLRTEDGGWVAEHRVVMARGLGRDLLPGENVHHINGVRDDNRPENLELWVTYQPKGQRPADLVEWAQEILRRYGEAEEVTGCPSSR